MKRIAVLTLAGAVGVTLLSAVPAHANTPKHISGNQTIPVYNYATAMREVVYVESPVDSDADGQPDRIAVDIVRPIDTTQPNLKVPAIIDASPYYRCCGRGLENEKKVYANDLDPGSPVTKMPLYYDNFFVPRGYAFLGVDLAGTARSTGCADVGGAAEILGAKAVVDWLAGNAKAFRANGTQAFATWATGKAGMIGKSWDGAIANGVAATGVSNLATIVPISSVSSWYDYQRFNAGVRAKAPKSMLSLHNTVENDDPTCAGVENMLSANASLSYSPFWAQRDYVASAANVKAAVFAVHGMNDQNTRSSQFGLWWERLTVPRKLWLSQVQHVDPFDFRRAEWVATLHRWFDQWLQDLDTGIMDEPVATVERGADVWAESSSWPPAGTTDVVYSLRPGNGGAGELTTADPIGGQVSLNDVALLESTATSGPDLVKNGRTVFATAPLRQDLHLAGSATVVLHVRSSVPTTTLTARLVDYGQQTRVNWALGEGITKLFNETCWGATSATDDPCYAETKKNVVNTDVSVLSRGWLDQAHRNSLSAPMPMPANEWQVIAFRLHATDQVIPAGHRLALVINLTDSEWTTGLATGGVVDIDLNRSLLRLPTAP